MALDSAGGQVRVDGLTVKEYLIETKRSNMVLVYDGIIQSDDTKMQDLPEDEKISFSRSTLFASLQVTDL